MVSNYSNKSESLHVHFDTSSIIITKDSNKKKLQSSFIYDLGGEKLKNTSKMQLVYILN